MLKQVAEQADVAGVAVGVGNNDSALLVNNVLKVAQSECSHTCYPDLKSESTLQVLPEHDCAVAAEPPVDW